MVSEKQLVVDWLLWKSLAWLFGKPHCRADLCLHLHTGSHLGHASEQNFMTVLTKQYEQESHLFHLKTDHIWSEIWWHTAVLLWKMFPNQKLIFMSFLIYFCKGGGSGQTKNPSWLYPESSSCSQSKFPLNCSWDCTWRETNTPDANMRGSTKLYRAQLIVCSTCLVRKLIHMWSQELGHDRPSLDLHGGCSPGSGAMVSRD